MLQKLLNGSHLLITTPKLLEDILRRNIVSLTILIVDGIDHMITQGMQTDLNIFVNQKDNRSRQIYQ